MKKLIFLLKRKPGTTKEAFREYYEASHVRLAQKYIGHLLTEYRRSYPRSVTQNPTEVGGKTPEPFGYDVVTEMRFKSDEALAEFEIILKDPKVNPILIEDERRFLDRESVVMLMCEEIDTGTRLR
jgi:hypothetical protein